MLKAGLKLGLAEVNGPVEIFELGVAGQRVGFVRGDSRVHAFLINLSEPVVVKKHEILAFSAFEELVGLAFVLFHSDPIIVAGSDHGQAERGSTIRGFSVVLKGLAEILEIALMNRAHQEQGRDIVEFGRFVCQRESLLNPSLEPHALRLHEAEMGPMQALFTLLSESVRIERLPDTLFKTLAIYKE